MKKFVIALSILALVACLVTLCACNNGNKKLNLALDNLNDNNSNYNKVTVTLQTTNGDLTLTNSYALTQSGSTLNIEYTVQTANKFAMQSGKFVAPEETVSAYSGTATVVGGVVNDPTGKLDINPIALNGFRFGTDTSNFANAKYEVKKGTETIFSTVETVTADVVNPQAFLHVDAQNMKLEIYSSTDSPTTLTVTYNDAQGSAVKILFTFEKIK